MSDQTDIEARMKRVRAKVRGRAPVRVYARETVDERQGVSLIGLLKPQLAFLLGFAALIAGRAAAMSLLEPGEMSPTLGWADGVLVLGLLAVLGLLFGRSDRVSHVALVVGAWVAFVGESYYVPMVPDLMAEIYSPGYVNLVLLGG